MPVRGVRGATTVDNDTAAEIMQATRELLAAMVQANDIHSEDVAWALFTATPDVRAAFPARAAREMGWMQVPLMDAVEMDVPGALPRCIRILLEWNTDLPQAAIRHIYLRDAVALRPDLTPRR